MKLQKKHEKFLSETRGEFHRKNLPLSMTMLSDYLGSMFNLSPELSVQIVRKWYKKQAKRGK